MNLVLVKSVHRHAGGCSSLFVLTAFLLRQDKSSASSDKFITEQVRSSAVISDAMIPSIPGKGEVEGKGDDTWG